MLSLTPSSIYLNDNAFVEAKEIAHPARNKYLLVNAVSLAGPRLTKDSGSPVRPGKDLPGHWSIDW
jgi:hypothetical protein